MRKNGQLIKSNISKSNIYYKYFPFLLPISGPDLKCQILTCPKTFHQEQMQILLL